MVAEMMHGPWLRADAPSPSSSQGMARRTWEGAGSLERGVRVRHRPVRLLLG